MTRPNVAEWFEATARAHAADPAIEQGDRVVSYAELRAHAITIGERLVAAGVQRGQLVSLVSTDVVAIVAGMIGCLRIGAAFVPLDPSAPDARLRRLLDTAPPRALLVDDALEPRVRGLLRDDEAAWIGRLSISDIGGVEIGNGARADGDAAVAGDVDPEELDPDRLAYVYFTSGSTGEPKGIAGRLKAIDHFIRWEIETLGLRAGVRVSQLAHPTFDAVLRDIFVPLCAGGRICVPPDRDTLLDGPALAAWIDRARLNVVHCVPSLFRTMLAASLQPAMFRELRYVLLAGEALYGTDVARWMEVFDQRIQLVNLYGPSETTMTKFVHVVQASDRERQTVPIGTPMPGAKALLLTEQQKVCPPGVAGEIYLRTPYRALGYYGQPELTATVFVPNPFTGDAADIVYRTGDLGRWLEDGTIEFLGRRDQQVKVQGVRVELGEVEEACRRQPGVLDVAVVDRETPTGARVLCAYVVLDPAMTAATADTVAAGVATVLPAALRPAVIQAVERLPRTVTGKIDRRALPAPAWTEASDEAPATPVEELLAGVWATVLGVPRVGRTQSFFALGGHSLLATQALARVRQVLGREVPLRWLFETPTVAGVAARLAAETAAALDEPPVTRRPDPQAPLPLSFAQQRLWFLHEWAESDSRAYHVAAAVRVEGPWDAAAWHTAVATVQARHEALRTRLVRAADGTAQQMVEADVAPPVHEASLGDGVNAATLTSPGPARHEVQGARVVRAGDDAARHAGHAEAASPARDASLGDGADAATLTSAGPARHEVQGARVVRAADDAAQHAGEAEAASPVRGTSLADGVDAATLAAAVAQAVAEPFVLETAPLWRVRVWQETPTQHVVLLVVHHILADGWALGVLVRELSVAYAAARRGVAPVLGPMPWQLGDYVVWERAWLQGPVLQRTLAYWQALLQDAPTLALPLDRPRPLVRTGVAASVPVVFDAAATQALRAGSQRAGVTLFMLLLAGLAVLWGRASAAAEAVIGTVVANRRRPEWEGLVGMLANTLALRVGATGSGQAVLAGVRARCLDADQHSAVPFERLVDALGVARDVRQTPLFQVLLVLQNVPTAVVTLDAAVQVRRVDTPVPGAKFDLTVSVSETATGLDGRWEYATDVWTALTIRRWAAAWQQLLAELVAHPEQPVETLPWLSDAERTQIVETWNATTVNYGAFVSLHQLVQAQAARTPEAIAVTVGETSLESLTYAELLAQATALAHALQARGVGPETRVGVYLTRDPQLIVALLAILLAGGAYVPLDPSYPAARVHHMLHDSGAPLVLTTTALAAAAGTAALPVSRCLYLDAPKGTREPADIASSARHAALDAGHASGPRSAADADSRAQARARGLDASLAECEANALTPSARAAGVRDDELMPSRAAEPRPAATAVDSHARSSGNARVQHAPVHAAQPSDPQTATGADVLPASTLGLDASVRDGEAHVAPPRHAARPFVAPPTWPAQAAYVIYTSGSTGVPKGVINTHEAIVNRLRWMQATYALTPHDRVLHKTPISFDVSVWELFWPLITGARLVMARPEGHRDSAYLAQLMADESITIAHFVPSMLTAWLEEPALETQARTLRHIICSGEALTGAQQARVEVRLPHVTLSNLYGPTEAAIDVSAWICERGAAPVDAGVPIGRPIANLRWYVLDRHGEPQPAGVPGELYLGGIGLARGYHAQPGRTAERFVPDPFGPPGSRLYRTGDRVLQRADGIVDYLGRLDGQIKLRGQRIELGEIETALVSLASIRAAAVRVIRDQLIAYIVPAANPNASIDAAKEQTRDIESWRSALADRLPAYMVPTRFVILDSLPQTANGKLDRQALPDPPAVIAEPSVQAPQAPRTAAEQALASIWRELLAVDHVGRDANFFELGGDSIISLQVVARTRAAGWQITPRQVFQYPTVAALAAIAGPVDAHALRDRAAIPDIGPLDWLPIARWWWTQPTPAPHHFNQAVALDVTATWATAARIGRAVDALVARHAALRLRVSAAPERTAILLSAEPSRVWSEIDLEAAPAHAQSTLRQRVARQLQASLSLERGPVLRVAWITRGGAEHPSLIWVTHHLAIDGVSWRVLLDELELACRALADGPSAVVPWPERTASLRAWSAALQQYARTRAAETETESPANYWTTQAAIDTPQLPLDDVSAEDRVAHARQETVVLEQDETRQLLERVPAAYGTHVDEVLLAAIAETLTAWTGASAVRIALEGHGREQEILGLDAARSVGWFTTIYPLVLHVPQPASPASTLKAIKEQMRAVPDHGLGYGALRYLADRTDVEPACAPEIVFNYLGQFDQTVGAARAWQRAAIGAGPAVSPGAHRPHRLEVSAAVSDGRLRVTWQYGAGHHLTTIAGLAARSLAALRALIAHATQPDIGGYTPADFPDAVVSQIELDTWDGVGRPIEDAYPLTPMQEGLLFHSLSAPRGGVYIEQIHCRLTGHVDVEALRDAWNAVAARHAVLRTEFVWADRSKPLQRVRRRVAVPFTVLDWRDRDDAAQQTRLRDLLAADREAGFEFNRAPLLRVTVARLGDASWELIWTYHHLLLDGWSMAIIVQELFAFYEASRRGEALTLPPVRPYRDYVMWLRQQDADATETFWRRALAGLTMATTLSIDRWRTASVSSNEAAGYDHVERRVEPELAARLTAAARAAHLTLNTMVEGAWAMLASRYAGTRRVVYGMSTAGKPATLPGADTMVGLFVNTVPVHLDVDPAARVGDWLRALQRDHAELRQHEWVSLVDLHRWSDVPRGQPLFEMMFAFENYPVGDDMRGGRSDLRISGTGLYENTDYPLTVLASPHGGLTLRALFDTRRFAREAVARLLEHFERLLAGVLDDYARIETLDLLTSSERAQIESAWRATAVDHGGTPTIDALIQAQVARTPDALAVAFDGDSVTYRELDLRATRLARLLAQRGVGLESRVAVCLHRSLDLPIVLLAVLKAGAAYVPLDPGHPVDRLQFMIADSDASLVITTRALIDAGVVTSDRVLAIDAPDMAAALRDAPVMAFARTVPAATARAGIHAAYVIYTSGSTGQPKGVVISHAAICNHLQWMQRILPIGSSDRLLQKTPVSFDASVWEFWTPLIAGAAVVMAEPDGHLDAAYLARACRDERITILQLVPSMLRMMVDEPRFADCASLRRLFCGGEVLTTDLQARLASVLPDVTLHNLYGPTETAIDATYWPCESTWTAPSLPIGRALDNVQTYVCDAAGRPLPDGLAGELLVGGTALARGYLGRPGLTAARFVPSPFAHEPGGRLYRTGDRVRRTSEGVLAYLGRIDQQVKLRGYRIEPGEIEAALAACPAVQDAAVVVREPAAGERQLVAYLVPADDRRAAGALSTEESSETRTAEALTDWTQVFDQTYAPSSADTTTLANTFVGWTSSYTGQPLPDAEMHEWLDETVDDIVAQRPRRILEIGCGTGLLLFRLAPHCEEYVGTDLSASVVDAVTHRLAQLGPAYAHVAVRQQRADELEAPRGYFDAVVLNSVVQYFPGAEYLHRVLTQAMTCLAPGGILHVGDVRSLPLLRAFHASVQVYRAPARTPVPELRRRIDAAVARDAELVLAPRFFVQLARAQEPPASIEIAPKRSSAANELNKFRYQVRIQSANLPSSTASPASRLDQSAHLQWGLDVTTMDGLLDHIEHTRPAALVVERVPNARVAADVRIARLTARDDLADLEALLGAVRDERDESAEIALEPDVLRQRLEALSYDLAVDWSRHDDQGTFDLLVWPSAAARPAPSARSARQLWPSLADADVRGAAMLANDPLAGARARAFVPHVREWLQQRLPDYMVPAAFVVLDRLPRATSGKIDRRALPEPDTWRPDFGRPYVEPRTDAERVLAATWADVLRLEKIGVHDNFFELGGDSIMGIQAATKARRAGLVITPKQIFEHQTVAELAQVATAVDVRAADVQEDVNPHVKPDGAVERTDDGEWYPLSPLQEGLLYHSVTNDGAYVVQMVCRIDGEVRPDALRAAWALVFARHSALRTEFVWADGVRPRQRARTAVDVDLPWRAEDWRETPASDIDARLRAWLDADRREGCDPAHAPLTRLALLRTGGASHLLVWTAHHLILDGWSSSTILRELALAYDAETHGRAAALPPAPPYRDYIDWLQRQDVRDAKAFWTKELAGLAPAADLPFAPPHAAAAAGGARGSAAMRLTDREVTRRWSREQSAAIEQFARTQHLALNTIAQAIWALLLGWRTPRVDVVFGVTVSGRPADLPGMEHIVGPFINTLPRRVSFGGRRRVAAWLRDLQGRDAAWRAYEHTPLSRIHAWTGVPAGSALFHSLLVFENYAAAAGPAPALAVQVSDIKGHAAETYPLVALVTPGTSWAIQIKFDSTRVDVATADALLDQFELVARLFVERPQGTLSALCTEIAAVARRERDLRDTEMREQKQARLGAIARRRVGTR